MTTGMDNATRALRILTVAYDKDEPVWVLGQTRRRADGTYSVSRNAAEELVGLGLARRSRPRGLFLLLTPHGLHHVGLA